MSSANPDTVKTLVLASSVQMTYLRMLVQRIDAILLDVDNIKDAFDNHGVFSIPASKDTDVNERVILLYTDYGWVVNVQDGYFKFRLKSMVVNAQVQRRRTLSDVLTDVNATKGNRDVDSSEDLLPKARRRKFTNSIGVSRHTSDEVDVCH